MWVMLDRLHKLDCGTHDVYLFVIYRLLKHTYRAAAKILYTGTARCI